MAKTIKEQYEAAKAKQEQARQEANNLEAQYIKEVKEPLLKQYIGKCYRYRNSYSDDKSWWMYVKVTGIKNGELIYCCVEKTANQEITIKINQYGLLVQDNTVNHNYIPITPAEYNKMAKSILSVARRMVK